MRSEAAPLPAHAHQFDDLDQQRESATLGVWVFLVTEIMFFSGMFLGYAIYRGWYSEAFKAASQHLDVVLGAINTGVLLCSSLTMAIAVHWARHGSGRKVAFFLGLTILLASVFLGIKGVEYYHKFEEGLIPVPGFQFEGPDRPYVHLFFSFYFAMTGMHALHMVIGIGVMAVIIWMALRGRYSPEYNTPVENVGLYWHFVDIVWVFLFPLLYLIDRT